MPGATCRWSGSRWLSVILLIFRLVSMFISFVKQNTGSDNNSDRCSSLVRMVKCCRELVNQVLRKECEWRSALRSQTLVTETCWLIGSLRDFAHNLNTLCASTQVGHENVRHFSSHVRHDVSRWFRGNMSKADIDVEEMLIIRAVRHRLLSFASASLRLTLITTSHY